MNGFTQTLSNTILGKSFDECDLAELQNLSEKFPYASSIQLLYAQKLKQCNHEDFDQQAQKTFLFFKDPVFINHLIHTNPTTLPLIQPNEETEELEAVESTEIVEQSTTSLEMEEAPAADITSSPNHDEEAIEQHVEEEDLPPLPSFKIEAIDPAKAELSFTPYYTVDYFAAQGIKLTDAQAQDRFGTQLKSFTSWLKHMKRLPGAINKSNISLSEEKTIEKMAAQSVSGENADTEAMAEVWIKQGDLKKAIAIYKKLSLQIPTKSAYFAAKIDHLKK